ncbi:META and DUF4377 domain-containing protein [Pulveribacter sp.]|uniref:META and DUF4377 domain-containing protein n=1 Tax=Pulveribacter sp. TaxID=2678893 RepID=UPI0028B0FF4C|nr:META and DUF4377 domain-containing protein [Pulveribacter sp.]
MRAPNACKSLSALSILSLAALLAACAGVPQGSQPASPALPGSVVAPPPAAAMPQLTAYDWELVAMSDRHGRSDTRWRQASPRAPRLHFENGRVSLHNLCNVVSSSYQLRGSMLELTQGVSTRRACAEPALNELEQRMTAALSGAISYEVRNNAGGPPLLVLHFNDASRWELKGTPTPQTQYGGPGERVFLEVAPHRVACSQPLMRGAQCLRVREVRFGDNGVRQGTGEWYPLYTEIEGYQHEPGMRNVLRLNRFKRQQAPADASPWVYVLDMVVESERVR